ncbi:hypothetical protein BGW37DRAFT_501547 [Umbelopsis sp. PMI_123]|nr:hypothetical protein BGW37DRAFT_501547 [Umbelopsis sp. PMI_123]
MSEFVLGPHNGLHINGTKPRRPKRRKNKDPLAIPTLDPSPSIPTPAPTQNPQQCEPPPTPVSTAGPSEVGSPPPPKTTTMIESEHWSVRQTETGSFEVNINSINNITDLLQTLSMMASESEDTNADALQRDEAHSETSQDSEGSAGKKNTRKLTMPFINFHSELYAQQDKTSTVEWPRMKTALPALLDECVHYTLQCMNPYYPVRPRRLLMKWYSSLEEPTKDPLVLAIGTYFVRHIFIHHSPAFDKIRDMKVLDAVQTQLALYAREALSDCFDVAHPHHIYALCLYNMNSKVPNHLKAFYHTIAVRMALELKIVPRKRDSSNSTMVDDELELNNRIWWYLFQMDHFLTESEIISCSILKPTSDDHVALSKLVRPSPCSLDEPDEVTGSHHWNNILKLWLIRRRLEQEIEVLDADDTMAMTMMSEKVEREINKWTSELPYMFQQDIALNSENFDTMAHMCFSIGIERCTNRILLHRLFFPAVDEMNNLTPLQHQSAMYAVESVVELLSMRRAVIDIQYCQTWPGDLKRAIEMLMICVQFHDTTVMTRSKLGLMRALRLLREMPETEWKEDMCMRNIARIEKVLSSWPESPTPTSPSQFMNRGSFDSTIHSSMAASCLQYTPLVDGELYMDSNQAAMYMPDISSDALAFLDSNLANC